MNAPIATNELIRQMVAWRQHLHANPELGNQEKDTAAFVAEILEAAGIEVHRGVGGNGVVGVLRGNSDQPSLGFRAELDALPITETQACQYRSVHPERMHACGHDGHMAMLLGGAQLLAHQRDFSATVVFIFQPDEERGSGAKAMVADGLFERFPIDAMFAIHNLPGLETGSFAMRTGPIMACEDIFSLTINAKGGHAAMPHRGVDAITTAAQVVMALQTIVSRQIDPLTPAVLSITEFFTNGSRNILPGQVVLHGEVRSYSATISQQIETTIEEIANNICCAHGATCQLQYNREFTATCNTAAETAYAQQVAQSLAGTSLVTADCPALMASDDFGIFLESRPGSYVFLGNGDSAPLHSGQYDFNDALLKTGAEFWAALALGYRSYPS